MPRHPVEEDRLVQVEAPSALDQDLTRDASPEFAGLNIKGDIVTETLNGRKPKEDAAKLDAIEKGAQRNVPTTWEGIKDRPKLCKLAFLDEVPDRHISGMSIKKLESKEEGILANFKGWKMFSIEKLKEALGISGKNTGDQVITLTGDAKGEGSKEIKVEVKAATLKERGAVNLSEVVTTAEFLRTQAIHLTLYKDQPLVIPVEAHGMYVVNAAGNGTIESEWVGGEIGDKPLMAGTTLTLRGGDVVTISCAASVGRSFKATTLRATLPYGRIGREVVERAPALRCAVLRMPSFIKIGSIATAALRLQQDGMSGLLPDAVKIHGVIDYSLEKPLEQQKLTDKYVHLTLQNGVHTYDVADLVRLMGGDITFALMPHYAENDLTTQFCSVSQPMLSIKEELWQSQ